MIGIDTNTWLIYEGTGNYGRGVVPTPLLSVATLVTKDDDWAGVPADNHLNDAKHVFREDSFDPVTRVRRGRLYQWVDGCLQQQWHCHPHPSQPNDRDHVRIDGILRRSLHTYHPMLGTQSRINSATSLLVLGSKLAPTAWRIVSAEMTISGEELITLRARSNLGVLPEVMEDALPEIGKKAVISAVASVVDSAFRSSPVSLVDTCRAATTTVLAHWLAQNGDTSDNLFHDDIGRLVKRLESCGMVNDSSVIASTIKIIQRFHSRGKPNEQISLKTRPLSEEDAQLALQSFGFLLQEIGWTR